jgi:hypothetical protein
MSQNHISQVEKQQKFPGKKDCTYPLKDLFEFFCVRLNFVKEG